MFRHEIFFKDKNINTSLEYKKKLVKNHTSPTYLVPS